jgi:hypothetical protein
VCCIACLALIVATPAVRGDDAAWKAGVAAVKITPGKPVLMSGYAARVRPFERVEQDLYAKALALEDAGGHRALVLTMDLIGLSPAIAEPVCERISQQSGLRREQILLSYAHNHAGPMLSMGPREGTDDPPPRQETVEYTRWVQDRLVEVAGQALGKLEPARLSWGTGVADFVMNRREFTPNGVILGVNPRGPADRCVPVLRVDDGQGRPRAVLFGCACHNTTLGQDNYAICGDYAGFAQAQVEQRQSGVVALFMSGCGGDANPYPRNTMDHAKRHGGELGDEVCRVMAGKVKPVSGPLRTLLEPVELPLQAVQREQLAEMAEKGPGWQRGNARTMLAMLDRGNELPKTYRAPVGLWQFGGDLTLVALPGEVVVDYAHRIEKAIGPLGLWPAAYCNDYFGYLPSARVIAEGGYENRGLSSGAGWFAPEAEEAMVEKVRELARKAKRPMGEE